MKTNQSLTTTNFIGYAQEEYENLNRLLRLPRHSLEVPTNISISSISLKRISYTYPIKSSGSVEKK